mgnify:CR=1 FL=1
MKQTLESAAINELFFSYACTSRNLSFAGLVYDRNAMLNMFQKGAEWHAKQSIEVLSSVLENWVHGGDADCIIAEFEEKLNNK